MSGYETYHARRRLPDTDRFQALRAFYDDLDMGNALNTQSIEWIEIGPAHIPGIRVNLADGTRFDLHISQIERR